MTRLSLAILGTAVILTSTLAGPAMAMGTMAKGAKDKQAAKGLLDGRSPNLCHMFCPFLFGLVDTFLDADVIEFV